MGLNIFAKQKFIGYTIETAFNNEENKRYWCVFSLFQIGKGIPQKKLTSYDTGKGTDRMQFDTKQEAIDKLYSFDKNPKITFIENIDKCDDLKNLEIQPEIVKSIVVNGSKDFWFYNIRTFFGFFNKKMIFKGAYANQISFKQNFIDGSNKPGLIPEQLLVILFDNQKRIYNNSLDFESMEKFHSGISLCLEALKEWGTNNVNTSDEVNSDNVSDSVMVTKSGKNNYRKKQTNQNKTNPDKQ